MADLIGQRFGQYEIMALIGEGGMATVYRARQLTLRREVAIKVIKTGLLQMDTFVRRFEREAETVAALSHPHILKVFDYGQHEDTVYLVMELLTGGSLAELVRKGPLPLDRTSRVLDQIAPALDYAHELGVIHRDLKPQNVLMDSKGNAFLTDFGIAKIVNATTSLTQSGVVMGTPAYMSPEQWMGKTVDARSDIYALGVMLFEMLSGQQPFNAETPASMMYMHLQAPSPSILQFRSDLNEVVAQVLNKALMKEPDQRFATANELATAFKAALVNKPLSFTTFPAIMPASAPAPASMPTPTTQRTPFSTSAPTVSPSRATTSPAIRQRSSQRSWVIIEAAVVAVLIIVILVIVLSSQRGQLAQIDTTTMPLATPTVVALVPTVAPKNTQIPPTLTILSTTTVPPTSPPAISTEPPTATPNLALTAVAKRDKYAGGHGDRHVIFYQNTAAL